MIQLRLKADNARIAALALSALSLFFSIFGIALDDNGLDASFFLSAIPAYNGSSLSALISVLPGAVLLVGTLAFKGKERKIAAVAASGIQLLALIMYYVESCHEPSDFITYLPKMLQFAIYPLCTISLGCTLYALLKKEEGAPLLLIAGIALTVIAIFSTMACIAPFGESRWYFDTKEYYLSTLFHYSASWLALPMIFRSVEAPSDQPMPAHAASTIQSHTAPVDGSPVLANNIELVKQLKDLLDAGAITQEDFDRKKKELLNL